MAKENDFDAAERATAPPPKPKKMGVWLLILMVAVALLSGATVYLMGIGRPGERLVENVAEKKAQTTALYLDLDPPFIVNFEDQGEIWFLQVSASIMAYDTKAIELLTYHMPRIRNALILLLGSQSYETIGSVAGKEKIREAMLQDIQKVMKE